MAQFTDRWLEPIQYVIIVKHAVSPYPIIHIFLKSLAIYTRWWMGVDGIRSIASLSDWDNNYVSERVTHGKYTEGLLHIRIS